MNYKIKSRIWIECQDGVFLGEGKVRLLKKIDELGSLSKAAKSLNISYRKAWLLLKEVNKYAQQEVMHTSIGGKGGGGAEITSYGKKLIDAFDQINRNCWEFLDQQAKIIEKIPLT